MKPRHLRDVARMCPAIMNCPGTPGLQCELEPGYDAPHKHEYSRWPDAHSRREPRHGRR